MSFNIYRQILAAAFFLLATAYLYKKNDKRKYWVYYSIAVLIHSSILPFGLLFFIKDWMTKNKYYKQRVIAYLCITILIFCVPRMMSNMEFLLNIIPYYGWYITRFKNN